MFLSKSCEYAIRASVYLTHTSKAGRRAGIIEIAEAIGSPVPFTGKILQTLTRKNILSSAKGPNGGFYMDNTLKLTLIDIVRAVDGNEMFTACVMGLKECSDSEPCPIHHQVRSIKHQLLLEFSRKSISEMVKDYEKHRYFLK